MSQVPHRNCRYASQILSHEIRVAFVILPTGNYHIQNRHPASIDIGGNGMLRGLILDNSSTYLPSVKRPQLGNDLYALKLVACSEVLLRRLSMQRRKLDGRR